MWDRFYTEDWDGARRRRYGAADDPRWPRLDPEGVKRAVNKVLAGVDASERKRRIGGRGKHEPHSR
jgi:hypothetical protein